ncbi:UNVERIFIED_CONTAM: hypothetical protein PYX00_009682 [Menopon gallinae]|uniref:Radial spoke head protein 9 homolog n=1 Tax=Menopon gallinae TaxID=328185 RepID=A0AAW2HCK1_9NEOP
MNVNKLQSALDCIGYSGNTLSNEQWIVLHNALTVLQTENHFKNVYLWGIIQGQEADYYVAYGYEQDALFGQKYYYSNNLIDWGVLPTPTEKTMQLTELCQLRFQGDPALVVEVIDDDPGPAPEDIEKKKLEICLAGGDAAEIEALEKQYSTIETLKEEERLAATVGLINFDVVSVPRGALMKLADGKVVVNLAFEGLPMEESQELKNYVHYRKPVQRWNTNLLTRKDYNYALDFLDSVDIDLPKGCWSMQYERGGKLSILRNIYWIGYTGYHWNATPDWGYFYVGNGRKNWDVPFMIFS